MLLPRHTHWNGGCTKGAGMRQAAPGGKGERGTAGRSPRRPRPELSVQGSWQSRRGFVKGKAGVSVKSAPARAGPTYATVHVHVQPGALLLLSRPMLEWSGLGERKACFLSPSQVNLDSSWVCYRCSVSAVLTLRSLGLSLAECCRGLKCQVSLASCQVCCPPSWKGTKHHKLPLLHLLSSVSCWPHLLPTCHRVSPCGPTLGTPPPLSCVAVQHMGAPTLLLSARLTLLSEQTQGQKKEGG